MFFFIYIYFTLTSRSQKALIPVVSTLKNSENIGKRNELVIWTQTMYTANY